MNWSYKWPARVGGMCVLVAAAVVHVKSPNLSPITPAILSAISALLIFATLKTRLVALYSPSVTLKDLQNHDKENATEDAVRMFGWLLVLCAAISAGVCIESAASILDAITQKTWFETIALLGGLIGAYRATLRSFGNLALGLVARIQSANEQGSSGQGGSNLQMASQMHKLEGQQHHNIDQCDPRQDVEEIGNIVVSKAAKYVVTSTTLEGCGCVDIDDGNAISPAVAIVMSSDGKEEAEYIET